MVSKADDAAQVGDVLKAHFSSLDPAYLDRVTAALFSELGELERRGLDSKKGPLTLRVLEVSWLAKEMRRLREAAGMTQKEAAREMDLSFSAILRKENGINKFTKNEVVFLAELYQVTDPDHIERLCRSARRKGQKP